MDTPLQLLQSLLATSNEKCLPGLIKFCSETKVFCRDKNKGQDVASLINSLFSKPESDEGVLILLQAFVPQCPRDLLSSNIMSWIQNCTKRLINTRDGSISTISFILLSELIHLSKHFPDVRKEIALSVIPKTLDHIIREGKNAKEDGLIVLQCLEQTLTSYGKSCGMHKEEISTLIFSFLELSPSVVHTSAKCFLKLAASGTPGANGENYANNWFLQEKFLLNTLHGLMDSLFENIDVHQIQYRTYDLGEYKLQIPEIIEKSLLRKKQRLGTYFQSLAEFLCVHLLGSFPAPKKVLAESILNAIWRGLSVNCSTLMNVSISADVSILFTVISEVNLFCLKLLNALIISCHMNLISYSRFICRILSQILNWTNVKDWSFAVGRPHRSVRVEAYTCTANWLTVSRASSGIDQHMDDIMSSIISDVKIEPPQLTLKVPTSKGKGKNRKKNKDVPVPEEHIVNKKENEDTCKAALDMIPAMLSSVSTVMKPDHHKLLQEVIVSKLLEVQYAVSSPKPIPYSSENCRLSLYKALLSLCNNHHPSFPPPINFATIIFPKGMKDTSIKVVAFCVHALGSIGKVLKPPFPSLEFPFTNEGLSYFDIENINSSVKEKQDKINENINQRQFLNSTPVHDYAVTNHSFKNLDKSHIDQSSEKNNKQSEEFSVANEHQIGIQDIESLAQSESHNNYKELSSLNKNISDQGKSVVDVTEHNETLPSKSSEVSTTPEVVDNHQIANINGDLSNNETERKRDLEEKDEDENSSKKKVKINGMSEEVSLIIEDSDDEMMNSFVDEVIDV